MTIVGSSVSANGPEAFRWTEATGMIPLGDLDGGTFSSIASGVSSDGNVIVGVGHSSSGEEGIVWTPDGGLVSISSYLTNAGLGDAIAGWQLNAAGYVSADGSTILGGGIDPSGARKAWLATVTVIPEPSSIGLLVIGCAMLVRRKR